MTQAANLPPETKERALALLREAIAANEQLPPADRENMRRIVGLYARDIGLAEAVGYYGRDEITAVEAARDSQWHQAFKQVEEMEAAALEQLHARKFADARQTYQSAESLHQGFLYDLSPRREFFTWLLDVGGADLALEFYRSDDWTKVYGRLKTDSNVLRDVSSLAKALISSDRRKEGLQLLEERGAIAGTIGDYDALASVGRALWVAGERTEGRSLLRRAARFAMAWAPWKLDAVVSVVADLCAIDDNEEAAELLRRLLKLAPPISDDERVRWSKETSIPTEVPSRTFAVVSGPGPGGEENWERARASLAKALTRAGLDEEASVILTSLPDRRQGLLTAIVEGKAMQGRFTEAFQAVDQAKATLSEYSASQVALACHRFISRHAAKEGDAAMFRRAWAMRPPNDSPAESWDTFNDLTELAHAGQAEAALECARTMHQWDVPKALISVIAGLTNVGRLRPSTLQDEFYS